MEMINQVVAEIEKINPYVREGAYLMYKIIVAPAKAIGMLSSTALKFETELPSCAAKELINAIEHYKVTNKVDGELRALLVKLQSLGGGVKLLPINRLSFRIIARSPNNSKEIINVVYTKKEILQFISEVNKIL